MTKKQKRSTAITIIAVSVGVACFNWWHSVHASSGSVVQQSYIDTETGKVEYHPSDATGRLLGASGKPTVVRAFFFAPAGHPEKKKLYYLMRPTPPDAAVIFISTGAGKPARATSHLQIRPADGTDKDWVAFESPAGQNILHEPFVQDPTLISCD